ncbi:Asp23/Gls24 family envelope stress response protein ['Paenibacillus yunnanensis' Narsing Rao et al. 2020]|uniref:Asp23/Gls24 family envelope stress response protein n=1 Tax=Paenibacillus tengchongensis TaxID=2608684 RepID=UPI00124C5397|nr:Asp23/Gls24 family envelope stress response protein [Paenibacillus tengchongensis]
MKPSDYECRGTIAISNRTITKIAGTAIQEMQEITALMEGTTKRRNRKDFYKAVGLEVSGSQVAFRIFPIIRLGTPLPQISRRLQDLIKSRVEKMTGLAVTEVHVTICGIAP